MTAINSVLLELKEHSAERFVQDQKDFQRWTVDLTSMHVRQMLICCPLILYPICCVARFGKIDGEDEFKSSLDNAAKAVQFSG